MSDNVDLDITSGPDDLDEIRKVDNDFQAALGELGSGLIAEITDYHVEDTTLKTIHVEVKLKNPKGIFYVTIASDPVDGEAMGQVFHRKERRVPRTSSTPVHNIAILKGGISVKGRGTRAEIEEFRSGLYAGDTLADLVALQMRAQRGTQAIFLANEDGQTQLRTLQQIFANIRSVKDVIKATIPSSSSIGKLIANAINATIPQNGGEEA